MKQFSISQPLFRNTLMAFFSLSIAFASCSKSKDEPASVAPFAGQYAVENDDDDFTLIVNKKGGNDYELIEFGGFLNVPLKAKANGNELQIPTQTFTNGNGKSITISGKGYLITKSAPNDGIRFEYSVSGYANYDSDFEGSRK